MTAKAIPHEARLVRDPLFVDLFVHTRKDPHHGRATRINADRRTKRIHHIDALGLAQLPRPRIERIRLGRQRPHRAQVDHVARQFRRQRLLEIGRNLGILATVRETDLIHARNFRSEAHAAGALDAASHDRVDQRPHILVINRALVLGVARSGAAIAHRLVLQVALAALVADRAIERVVDQQKFHHAIPRLDGAGRLGRNLVRRAVLLGRHVANGLGARRDRLRRADPIDKAHPAVAGDRQTLVIAKARNLGARKLASLK